MRCKCGYKLISTKSQSSGSCMTCRAKASKKQDTGDISSYVTSKGQQTLAQIATEVGAVKLGAGTPHDEGQIKATPKYEANARCGFYKLEDTSRKELIQAAFPFRVKFFSGNRYQFNSKKMTNRFQGTRLDAPTGKIFDFFGNSNSWVLIDPMIEIVKQSKPFTQEYGTENISEPDCRCPMDVDLHTMMMKHGTGCLWKKWRRGS